jgi:hypothetical protein
MSSGSSICWTILSPDGVITSEMRKAFVNLMRERCDSLNLRTYAGSRLCGWQLQGDAQAFADELTKRTGCEWKAIQTHCDK